MSWPVQSQIKEDASFYSLMFFVISIGTLISMAVCAYSFGRVGQHLARRVRVALFSALLRQEVRWCARWKPPKCGTGPVKIIAKPQLVHMRIVPAVCCLGPLPQLHAL